MTIVAPVADQELRAGDPAVQVRWRQLAWVTWRQHRSALIGMLVVLGLAAVLTLANGARAHVAAARHGQADLLPLANAGYYAVAFAAGIWLFQLLPLLGGLFLGAPLLAREAENGTARLAWTQAASRTRWLLAQVVPVAVPLAIAATGLSLAYAWWLSPLAARSGGDWPPTVFDVRPLPFVGWFTLALSLGTFLGAVIRRAVPAMAATFASYAALLIAVSVSWRMAYLPPLHTFLAKVQFSAGGGYGYSLSYGPGSPMGANPAILSSALGWPDGRLLSNAELTHHSAAWFRLHHIGLWTAYQPGSRYFPFQLIEFGWLVTLSVILVAATIVLIRRRAA